MTLLSFAHRHGIPLALAAILVGALLLARSIRGLLDLGRRSRIATLPLQEAQPVTFAAAGRVVLSLQGPRLSPRFSELTFDLVAADGRAVPSRPVWFAGRGAGVDDVRLDLRSFRIPAPGTCTLYVRNLGPSRTGEAEHRILFAQPHLAQLALRVLGLIVAAGLLIGGLVAIPLLAGA